MKQARTGAGRGALSSVLFRRGRIDQCDIVSVENVPPTDREAPQCLLLGVKRTSVVSSPMSAFDPKADIRGPGLLPCELTPEPHFAGLQ